MRARSGSSSLAWLVGCALWAVGCSGSSPEVVSDAAEAPSSPPPAVQAIHHARQEVEPVLTWRESPSPTVPMTLTASDGSGLDLVAMEARVVIEDPLAFTELHLTFDNPEGRRREGRFEIELPPGAALSRLAMRIGGRMQEGEVVERAKARRTYETFMHTRPQVDPALLEHDSANEVRARVFPILPHERKEIIVSYSQELGREPYRLPLQGLSTIESFDAQVVVHTHEETEGRSSGSRSDGISDGRVVELRRSHFTPDKDLVVELEGTAEAAGLHAGPLAVVRVRPQADRPAARPEGMLVLFDTSASTRVGFEDRVETFGRTIEALAAASDFRLRVLSFDQGLRTIYEGQASAMGVDALADLVEGRALGASDLEAALAEAARSEARWSRVLLVSDGVPTAGTTDRAALRIAARRLESVGARRLDVLAPGARRDRERLADLSTALPESGVVLDDTTPPERIASGLTEAPFGDIALEVDGASWSWPRSLEGVAPGQDVLVFAHFDGLRPPAVRVSFSDPSIPTHVVDTLEVDAPLVERAWAGARIDRIEHELARLAPGASTARAELEARIVELSTHYRVLDERTALLVLETERDYRRFGITRRGRADILTVDRGSVRATRRSEDAAARPRVERDLAAIETSAPTEDEDPDEAARWEVARNSGVLSVHEGENGSMGRPPRDAVGDLRATELGDGPLVVGSDDEDVWGGLVGTEVGEAFGAGGLGLVGTGVGGGGTGPGYGEALSMTQAAAELGNLGSGLSGTGRGGGGTGEGTIGLGNTGLIGKGSGGGSGSGYGRGGGEGFGGRGVRVPRVRQAKARVSGSLDKDVIRRIVRAHLNEVRSCYLHGLGRDPSLRGRVSVQWSIGGTGTVLGVSTESSTLGDSSVTECINKFVRRWKFPEPAAGGTVQVTMPFVFDADHGVTTPRWEPAPWSGRVRRPRRPRRVPPAAHSGRFAEVQRHLAAGRLDDAHDLAWSWWQSQPQDVLALLALGETFERRDRPRLAARVYGSLIDLHPSRPDVRRTAGERLERLEHDDALALAVDTFAKAAAARPDHPSGARLHAWSLVKQGRLEEAFTVLREAAWRRYPAGRFAGVRTLLRQDLALVAAAWLARTQGDARAQVLARIDEARIIPATEPSARFVVTWETDTTDVDVLPRVGGRGRLLGRRIADVRTGYGPEARVLRGERIPDRLHAAVRYFDRGAMGHAMGTLHVVVHDGSGDLRVESRPFVLMEQRGVLDMGTFELGPSSAGSGAS